MAITNRWNKKNPYNPDNFLYRRLTKLLSGPIAGYAQQKPKYNQVDKFKDPNKLFTSSSGQEFKRQSYDPFNDLTSQTMNNAKRNERYVDFDQMEFDPILATALDIYADEITTANDYQEMLRITCENDEIKQILHTMFYDVLAVGHNLFGWVRNLCKKGDDFLYLDIDDELGVKNAISLPAGEVERLEGEDKSNPNYVQYQWNSAGLTLENWQVAHFRLLGNDKYAPYGSSVLDPARRIWRQLVLLEDAMISYRVVRSPERKVFYIDVGGIAPEDVEQYMQKVITSMKRNQVIDPQTGRVDLRYNAQSVEEDMYIAVRNGQSTKVEQLPGGQFTGVTDDVEYLRDKMLTALKIPKAYLQFGGDAQDQGSLAQKDIRFARTIQRIQRCVVSELEKIAIIHLFTLGYKGPDLLSFKLSLNNPSKLAELQELEQWKLKFDVASAATEGFFSKRWVSMNLFNISEDEFKRNQHEMFYDKKMAAALAALEGGGPGAEGGGMGGGGGGLPGLGGSEMDLGGEGTPEEAGAAEGGEEALPGKEKKPSDSDVLLASPEGEPNAKRDDKWDNVAYVQYADGSYETKGANGKKYQKVRHDARELAGRSKNYAAAAGVGSVANNRTKTFPGHKALSGTAKGLMENIDNEMTIYEDEEEKEFLTSSKKINDIITSIGDKKK